MRHTRWLALCGLILFTAAGSFASAIDDARITARIETSFALNKHLSPFNIRTSTTGGVVKLTGSVEDEVQKDLAGQLAASVEGVKQVENELVVVGPSEAPSTKRTWRQKVEDMTTSASVRTRLLYHKEFCGLKIDVKTENGVVTLFGLVGSEEQKAKVGQIAADTMGVAAVHNNLTVGPKSDLAQHIVRQVSDEWIEKHVETALLLNRHVNVRSLGIEVNDRVCILTGTVDSQAQRDLAESIAANTQGVKQVRNDIQVRASQVELEPVEPK